MGMRPFAISWPPERRAAEANGAAQRFSQIKTPAVLPGSIAAARLHDVVGCEELGEIGFDGLELAEFFDVRQFHRINGAVVVLGQDEDVDDADRPCVDERDQLFRHLAGEVACSGREFDDEVVDGP